MKKYGLLLFLGTLFGIALAKAEIISWFRIQEMFRFQAFHMYGVIGSAVILGVLFVQLIKRSGVKDMNGEAIAIADKDRSFWRYLLGGTIFGLGWALIGACPGPIFILIGYGYWSVLIVLLGAILGTFFYGVLRKMLPH